MPRECRRSRRASTARLKKLGAGTGALYSTLGRVLARALESELVAARLDGLARRARAQHERGRPARSRDESKWDPVELAQARARLRPPRGSARRARPLGRDLRRHGLALPGRGAHAPGTPRRATRRAGRGPTSRRWSARRWPTRSARSSCCARCTPSTPAWPAPCTCWTRADGPRPPAAARRRCAGRRATPIYVWEWPVRIVHWAIVLLLIVLSFTGYYIHHPFLSGSGGPGHPGFTMGLIRFLHEAAGFAFIAAVLVRIYWAFAGNRYARWRALLPITKSQRRDMLDMARFYAFLRRSPPRQNGHNPLAAVSYLGLYSGFLVTILTGLGLFAWVIRMPPWTTLFGWTYNVVGPADAAPAALPADVRLRRVRGAPHLLRDPDRHRGAQRRAVEHRHGLQGRPAARTSRRATTRAAVGMSPAQAARRHWASATSSAPMTAWASTPSGASRSAAGTGRMSS